VKDNNNQVIYTGPKMWAGHGGTWTDNAKHYKGLSGELGEGHLNPQTVCPYDTVNNIPINELNINTSDSSGIELQTKYPKLASLFSYDYYHAEDTEVTLGTLEYTPDTVYYRQTENNNIENTLQVPYKYNNYNNWQILDSSSISLLNTTITKTANQVFFPQGQPGNKLKDVSGASYPSYEIKQPELEYLHNKRTLATAKFIDHNPDSNLLSHVWGNDAGSWVTVPNLHINKTTAGWLYYLKDLYTMGKTVQKLDINELNDAAVTPKLSVDINVQQDNFSIGCASEFEKQIENKDLFPVFTTNGTDNCELNWFKYSEKMNTGKFANLHGTLQSRLLYRLNSRLPYIHKNGDKYTIKGVKSINRVSMIENDMLVSMWQNIRTVKGVSRCTKNTPMDRSTLLNNRESMSSSKRQAGFARLTKDNDYEYMYVSNKSNHNNNKVKASKDCITGEEIISVSKSNWECYAVSAPIHIKKKFNTTNNRVSYSNIVYEPLINYKAYKYDNSGNNQL
jgi:hypothetical protein